jgi:hypothetical protein
MRRGFDQFIGGAAVTVVFAVLWLTLGWGWWVIFPIVFGGLLPMIKGIQRLFSDRSSPRNSRSGPERLQSDREKEILRLAHDQHGVLTPAVVALHSSLSIDEADQLLGDLAKRGVARIEVGDGGRLSYEFPDFLPPGA